MRRVFSLFILAIAASACDSTSPNQPPTASFVISPQSPLSGSQVSFNASGSTDGDGTISNYQWTFGDGGTGSGVQATHTFQAGGSYSVTLTVTDDDGDTASSSLNVEVIPSMSGSWRGSFSLSGGSVSVPMNLTETSGTVSGSGAFEVGAENLPFTVSGSHAHPNFNLTIQSSGFTDANYSGTFSGNNTLSGSLNGSGFVNQSLTLTRQGSLLQVAPDLPGETDSGGAPLYDELRRALDR